MSFIKLLILSILCCIIFGCTHGKRADKESVTEENFAKKGDVSESTIKRIDVSASEPTRDEAANLLSLDSYIRLSNKELIGEVERILIENEQIFILDNTPKIISFDVLGNFLFTISKKGSGPEEYADITDFALDKKNNRIVILDNKKRKLVFYDINSGAFLSGITFNDYYARGLAVKDGTFYFSNPNQDIYEPAEKKDFYLLYSETGNRIDSTFLPHDAISEFNFSLGYGHPFFYNGDKLLYNTAFKSIVYELIPNQILPLYDIVLPNPLPVSEIESKIDHGSLVRSDYSYGLADIFEADSVLHFTFSKNRLIASVFYDLGNSKLLYCGYRVLGSPRDEIPFHSPTRGVYKDKFYSVISVDMVVSAVKNYNGIFSKDLAGVLEDDNPIIAFYKVHK